MPAEDAWEAYWRRTTEAAAHKQGGPQEEVLARFWSGFFEDALRDGRRSSLLDVGCGNGALIRTALATAPALTQPGASIIGVDVALAAVRELRKRLPTAQGVAADSRRMPFQDGAFDLVCSQFGIEYAGPEALGEAARLVAPGGVLAAVSHLKDGALYRECAANQAAVIAVKQSGVLGLLEEVVRGAFALNRGKGSRGALRDASARLAAAVECVETILRSSGPAVAGGAVARLHADVLHMQARRDAYDPAEVAAWSNHMGRELEAFAGRMAAMVTCAWGDAEVQQAVSAAESRGLVVRMKRQLLMGLGVQEPAAWVLAMDRS